MGIGPNPQSPIPKYFNYFIKIIHIFKKYVNKTLILLIIMILMIIINLKKSMSIINLLIIL